MQADSESFEDDLIRPGLIPLRYFVLCFFAACLCQDDSFSEHNFHGKHPMTLVACSAEES